MTRGTDLTGSLLIAMPDMGDSRFTHSVILLTAHSDDGAMGLIVNKPVKDLRLTDLLRQMSIHVDAKTRTLPIHFGGPVDCERGFVLHSADYLSADALMVGAGFVVTATQDVLRALSRGSGPRDALVALGYAGWGAGQLEAEIAANVWLTCQFDRDIVFGMADSKKWTAALSQLGISPLTLSTEAGHA